MFKSVNFIDSNKINWENRHIIDYASPASPDVPFLPDESCQNLDCKSCFPEIPLEFRPMTPLSSDVSSVYSFESENDDLNSSGFQSQSETSDVISERNDIHSRSPSTDFDETYFSVSKIFIIFNCSKHFSFIFLHNSVPFKKLWLKNNHYNNINIFFV